MDSNKVVYLEISSFIGMSVGAVHYYGKLQGYLKDGTYISIDLKHALTNHAARKINKLWDTDTFEKGDLFPGFDTKEELELFAIKTYKLHFPDAVILLLGNIAYHEPHKVLDGSPDFILKGNDLFRKAEKLGFYDKKENDAEMDRLSKEFYRLLSNVSGG